MYLSVTKVLHHIVHLGLDEFQQDIHGALAGALQLYRHAADGAHGLAHELHVHARGVPGRFAMGQRELFGGEVNGLKWRIYGKI